MLENFEEELISKLNTFVHTQKYFGELANPSETRLDINNLPLVYLDFVGSSKIAGNRLQQEHNFCLYIVHLSYSANKTTRTNKHYELYELFAKLKENLNIQSFANFEPITWGSSKKIYDQNIASGYLTVFTQNFSTIF